MTPTTCLNGRSRRSISPRTAPRTAASLTAAPRTAASLTAAPRTAASLTAAPRTAASLTAATRTALAQSSSLRSATPRGANPAHPPERTRGVRERLQADGIIAAYIHDISDRTRRARAAIGRAPAGPEVLIEV